MDTIQKRILIAVGVVIAILLLVTLLFWNVMFNSTNNASKQQLLEYLKRVYPDIDTTKSKHDYLKLYNSLGWFYQCCTETGTIYDLEKDEVIGDLPVGPRGVLKHKERLPGLDSSGFAAVEDFAGSLAPTVYHTNVQPLPCCSDELYKLPMVPEGFYYDWESFQYYNTPVIEIRSDRYKFADDSNFSIFGANTVVRDPSTYASQPPGYSFVGVTGLIVGEDGQPTSDTVKITAKDPLGVNSGGSVGLWVGPGAFYAGSRAFMKAMYYPFGPNYNSKSKTWFLNGTKDSKKWVTELLSVKELTSKFKIKKDYYNNKSWIQGFREGDKYEIGHVQSIPGLPQSTGYWFNYFGGGGTGVFYKCGRTPIVNDAHVEELKQSVPSKYKKNIDINNCSPRNKTHMLFTLLRETAEATYNPPVGFYTGIETGPRKLKQFSSGSELLTEMYGTADPWFITFWHCNGYAPSTKPFSNVIKPDIDGEWLEHMFVDGNKNQQGFWYPTGVALPDLSCVSTMGTSPVGLVKPMTWASPGKYNMPGVNLGPNQKAIARQTMQSFLLGLGSIGSIEMNGDGLYTGEEFYNKCSFAVLCSFLLQAEFGDESKEIRDQYYTVPGEDDATDDTGWNSDWIGVQGAYMTVEDLPNPFKLDNIKRSRLMTNADPFYLKSQQFTPPVSIGTPTALGVKYALTKVFMGNWMYDRVANGVAFDEPMNYFGSINGYETLQMTMNTNTNGNWSFESIDIRIPDRDGWADTLKSKRQYSWMTSGYNQCSETSSACTVMTYTPDGLYAMNDLFASNCSTEDPFDPGGKSSDCHDLAGISKSSLGQLMRCTTIGPVTGPSNKTAMPPGDHWKSATCKLTAENIGSTKTKTNAFFNEKTGKYYLPWGQCIDFGSKKSIECPDPSASFAYQDMNAPMGHAYCQAGSSDQPMTFSSIWGNVLYGSIDSGFSIVAPPRDQANK